MVFECNLKCKSAYVGDVTISWLNIQNILSYILMYKIDLPKYSPVFVLSCFSRPVEIVIIFVPLSIVNVLNLSSLKNKMHYILLHYL